jgi:hypothetical protein
MVVIICLYRFFTVRKALTSIPKSKLPISKEYLSKASKIIIMTVIFFEFIAFIQ